MAKRRTRQTRKRKLRGGNDTLNYLSEFNGQLDYISEFIKELPPKDQLALCPIFIGFIHYGYSKLKSLPDSPLDVLFSEKNILKQKLSNRTISKNKYDEENEKLNEQIHQTETTMYDKAHKLNQQLEDLMKSLKLNP
jgi:hypothetical protein